MVTTSPFLHLADSIRNPDHRQNALLALLEAQPATEAQAVAVLSCLHHKEESIQRRYRKRNMQLNFDPIAPQHDPCDGKMIAALDRLSGPDRELIEAHVLDGISLRNLAKNAGVSKDTIHKRYTVAANKLRILSEEKVDKTPLPTPYK